MRDEKTRQDAVALNKIPTNKVDSQFVHLITDIRAFVAQFSLFQENENCSLLLLSLYTKLDAKQKKSRQEKSPEKRENIINNANVRLWLGNLRSFAAVIFIPSSLDSYKKFAGDIIYVTSHKEEERKKNVLPT